VSGVRIKFSGVRKAGTPSCAVLKALAANLIFLIQNLRMTMPTTILLVDDHPVFRKGLRLLLEEEQDLSVVGEAGGGQEAIDLARELSPDIVVMDITMSDLNGIDATR